MQRPQPPLLGPVVERPSKSPLPNSVYSSSQTGFPSVQHRSKSAFQRARQNAAREAENTRSGEVPIVRESRDAQRGIRGREEGGLVSDAGMSGPLMDQTSRIEDHKEWKARMSRENDRAIEVMSEEERARHASEILEQLSPNVVELLHKAREARARTAVDSDSRGRETATNAEVHHPAAAGNADFDAVQPTPITPIAKNKFVSPPRSILSQPSSRSSSPGRSTRRLRFADVTPNDVHVYQSEPSSPRRPIGLLLPPTTDQDSEVNKIDVAPEPPGPQQGAEPEEGTPEYIRRRFFPNVPPKDPSLEWIESKEKDAVSDSEPRFDLSGALIPAAARHALPTHLGLHHHGGSSAAGYTLHELFLLARSSVPAQRATVLGVLSRLARRVVRQESGVSEIKDRNGVRSRALVLGLAAIAERGTVGVQAVDLVWTCVVYWDEEEVADLGGVELRAPNAGVSQIDEANRSESSLSVADPLSSLPFSALLPQVAVLLDTQSLPPESLNELLSILQRLARHSVEIASAICKTPRLVASVVSSFLLSPIPPSDRGSLPNPSALDFLQTLALSSRENARTLEGPADALLRFVTIASPLSASPFSPELTDLLLRGTLDLYATLGKYGLYSGVATTAAEHFNRLSLSILRSSEGASVELKISCLELLSVLMICAFDPHRTTPPHDLLWSQVVGWAWGPEVLSLLDFPGDRQNADGHLWRAVWDALASWLEGCRLNSARLGQNERDSVNAVIGRIWNDGIEKELIAEATARLSRELSGAFSESGEAPFDKGKERLARISETSLTLMSFTRLCLACLPKRVSNQVNQDACTPPWIVDAAPSLSLVASMLITSDVLRPTGRRANESKDSLLARTQVLYMRSTSALLASFVRLARLVRAGNDWRPLGLSGLQVLLPGDEESAEWIIEEIINTEDSQIECTEKLQFLVPFFKHTIRPDDTFYLSPLVPKPESIQKSTTQTLLVDCIRRSSSKQGVSGLPLDPDWPCVALDHLLRSGTSPILTNPDSVPDSWKASEVDLTQASLSLLLCVQKSLNTSHLKEFAPGFAHVVFNCMKVFMLEHNQQQNDSNQEVFRDPTVGRLMDALLSPFTLRNPEDYPRTHRGETDLEDAAKGFLGEGTPFFQFYTDFVALYDAISFSHPNFARLLLPPTSMTYPSDYRKLLWGDFGHTLRSIRIQTQDVPSPNLNQHFWPAETDAEILGWYLRALIKWPLDGFVRFVAIHHLACNIWSDLGKRGRSEGEEDAAQVKRSESLLAAIFNQAKSDVVRDVVRYVQDRDAASELRLPPRCFGISEEAKTARLAVVRNLGDTRIAESLEMILANSG